jgi:hypothetical protein
VVIIEPGDTKTEITQNRRMAEASANPQVCFVRRGFEPNG